MSDDTTDGDAAIDGAEAIDLDEPPLFDIADAHEPDLDDGAKGGSVNREGVEIPWEIVQYGNGQLPASVLVPIGIGGHRLHASAAAAFAHLQSSAAAAGIELTCTDTYRTYDQQVDLKQRKPSLSATPGKSVHGWGFAVDVAIGRPPRAFGQSVYAWLKANAPAHGWHLGRPKDEPWHWVYRGPIATGGTPAPPHRASAVTPPASARPTLELGAAGDAVRWLQERIGATADGQFGAATDAAVRAFQSANGLVADGVVGPKTWAALHGDSSATAPARPPAAADDNWSESAPADRPETGEGATGDVVRWIQRRVGVTADGQFGPATAAAVRAFQRTNGLADDGVVGPRTWAAMTS
jgi:peptidoglycan hydrolase-like protein with peptidoglycan-binding domain